MRFPRRFGLRTVMIVVALAALLAGAERMRQRRARFLSLAAEYAAEAQDWRTTQQTCERRRDLLALRQDEDGRKQAAVYASVAENHRRWGDHCEFLRQKYEQAAQHPWQSLPPDPEPSL